jgi:hypothetical protein
MALVKVVEVKSLPSVDRSRIGQNDWLVLYQIDGKPVTAIMIRKDKLTDSDIQAEIKAHESLTASMRGREFSL